MSDLKGIEKIVGVGRSARYHYGRVDSESETVYVLHSQTCLDRTERDGADLRDCPFTRALDKGIDRKEWEGLEDRPVLLRIAVAEDDRLVPVPIPGGQ